MDLTDRKLLDKTAEIAKTINIHAKNAILVANEKNISITRLDSILTAIYTKLAELELKIEALTK